MKKIIIKLAHIIYGGLIILLSVLLLPISKLVLGRKNVWLISERPSEARDNGLSFYNYLLKEHPEINCVYAINPECQDFKKIKGRYLRFGSLKHIFYFTGCKYSISSTTECLAPNSYLLKFQNKVGYPHKNVFLQHGVIKDNLDFLYKQFNNIDLFICGAEPEYLDVLNNYGYSSKEVAYTGLARFDGYFDYQTKMQILVMPTWRRDADSIDLTTSTYYKTWNVFLHSTEVKDFLLNNDLKIYFYLHPVFSKYINHFSSNNDRIIIADPKNYNVQTLLKESKILITDYSSIFFDFGYMKKPAIYYQFDQEYFFKEHYKKGYFSYEKDGFGYLVTNLNEVLSSLKHIVDNNFFFEQRFLDNHKRFFTKHDNKNCERIYQSIINL